MIQSRDYLETGGGGGPMEERRLEQRSWKKEHDRTQKGTSQEVQRNPSAIGEFEQVKKDAKEWIAIMTHAIVPVERILLSPNFKPNQKFNKVYAN